MIIAIPINDDRIANHFTKARQFAFFDPDGHCKATIANPALNANCQGKDALIDLLKQQGTTRVMVRQIGERILAKLLDNQFAVLQTQSSRQPITSILRNPHQCQSLTSPSQGRPSANFAHKHTQQSEDGDQHPHGHPHSHKNRSSGCGCGHHEGHGEHSCQRHNQPEGRHQDGNCCGSASHHQDEHHHGHGKGCCHD